VRRHLSQEKKTKYGTRIGRKKVAILVTDGFEQVELEESRRALDEAGARSEILSPKSGKVKAWKFKDWGDSFAVDRTLDRTDPGEFDALLLPGSQMNPDNLRTEEKAIEFVRAFAVSGKPIAAICHGPISLIEANVVKRKTLNFVSVDQDGPSKRRCNLDR
jgi:protease I